MGRRRALTVSALAVTLVVPLVGTSGADAAAPKVRVKVLVRGLDNPRGLAVANNGDLYIAQAGKGGSGPCFKGAEGPTCLGPTGKISRLRGGALKNVVTGLPSVALQGTGNNAIGPSDVSFNRSGRLFATIGLGFNPAVRTKPAVAPPALGGLGGSALAKRLASLNVINLKKGKARQLADIGAFEKSRNPDRGEIDTNPNAVVANKDSRVVADAGGNALLRVRKNGTVRKLAVFRNEKAVPLPGGPPGATIAPQPVPDSVVRGPDGAYYVGQLTGFPFVNGTATVFRVVPGKAPRVYADGFTNIIDLAFASNGDLLVLEIARKGLAGAFGPNGDWEGALIRVRKNGGTVKTKTLLTKPLFAPGGMAVDGRNIYISNRTVFAGKGQILRVRLG